MGLIRKNAGLIPGNPPVLRRKNKVSNRPNWEADLFRNGLEYGKLEKTPVLAMPIFRIWYDPELGR
jgi:hypothetical protein